MILAEDTRHSKKLLDHYGITTPMQPYHDFNERKKAGEVLKRLKQGDVIALISDAGMPLISDPGFALVEAAHREGIPVVPIPGPTALIAALAVAGLPTDRFVFEGFLPATEKARRQRLSSLSGEKRTMVFFEVPHRLVKSLEEMARVFGVDHLAVIAKELTKINEKVYRAPLGELLTWLKEDVRHQKGEFVVLLAGTEPADLSDAEASRVLSILLEQLPLKQAAALAAKILDDNRNRIYKLGLELRQK